MVGLIVEDEVNYSIRLFLRDATREHTIGTVEVDGTPVTRNNLRSWQRHIADVPQSIFLSDVSITEAIALGVLKSMIEKARVRQAARPAQIAELVESRPKQYGDS